MTTELLTPFDFSDPVPVGRRRFWKQLLPVTQIDYNGTKIDFDKPFHTDLTEAFKSKAYDQVPLVFADSKNQHNEDPRNFAGELLKVENRDDAGTWGLIEADEAGAKAIEKNPKLGVSARIMQGVRKSDGRTFPRAIRHVLLTMNPRVTGMSPWQAVDLSGDTETEEVVDLTATEYTEGTAMGKTVEKPRRQIDLSTLSDEDFERLVDLATEAGVIDDEDDEVEDENQVEDTTQVGATKKKKSKTKVTVEEDSEESGGDDEDEDDEEDEVASLSEADIARTKQTNDTVRSMQIDLAEEKWDRARSDYINAGVPPFLLDLAAPIMSSPDTMVIDLADGETHNATETVAKMLDGFKGLIDLSGESGHMIDLAATKNADDEDKQFLDAWDEQYG